MIRETVPWAGSGTDVTDCATIAEAIRQAGADFTVEVRQGHFCDYDASIDGDRYVNAEGFYYVVKINDEPPIALGQCKTRFTPLQNQEAFEFLTPLILNGTCVLDTIGVIDKGQKVWVMCKLAAPDFLVGPGDALELYLFMMNAHDSSTKATIGIIPMRIWCANMFSMIARSDYDIIKLKHSGDMKEKLERVRTTIDSQIEYAKDLTHKLQRMCLVWPTPEALDGYFRTVFNIKKEASTKSENKVKKLKELFVQGRGNQAQHVRGTWYAAYNAVSEYLNYDHGRSVNSRLLSLWTGVNSNVNTKALRLAYEEAIHAVSE